MEESSLVGKTVMGYRVVERLGGGAFGTVYQVEKTNAAGRQVRALKHVALPEPDHYREVLLAMGGDRERADRYFAGVLQDVAAEVRILRELGEDGPRHIVRYFDNDIVESGTPRRYDVYILMERLMPLEQWAQVRGDMTVREAVQVGLDVLDALSLCHENHVIHRDVKEANIFVSPDGAFKLGDLASQRRWGPRAARPP